MKFKVGDSIIVTECILDRSLEGKLGTVLKVDESDPETPYMVQVNNEFGWVKNYTIRLYTPLDDLL